MRKLLAIGAAIALLAAIVSPAQAGILVTNDTSAASLAAAVTAGGGAGLTVTGSSLSGHTSGLAASSGTYLLTPGGNAYGITDPGIVLSSGDAAAYSSGPNTSGGTTTGYGVPATGAQEALLDPITGGGFDHFDVTELDITFDVDGATGDVSFFVTFGSEEFAEFVGSSFIDGFGLFLNGVNIAFSGGFPVNINHPDMASIAETELDGVLAPGGLAVVVFTGSVTPGSTGNTLKFIVADASDSSLDTTVYISSLGGGIEPPGQVPEPASLAIWGLGALGALFYRRRQRKTAA